MKRRFGGRGAQGGTGWGDGGLVQAEKVRDAVLDPPGEGLPFGGRGGFVRGGRAVRQIVLRAHAEITLDGASAHRARVQLAETRRADARVAARQQGAGQRIELAHDAQLFLSGAGQTDQACR